MAFDAARVDHERPSVSNKRVLLFVGGFLVFVAVLMGMLLVFYRDVTHAARVIEPLRRFPGPELQPNPQQDYSNFRTGQDASLEGYGWADSGKTLIHVPIERAMAFVAGRGASAYEPLGPTADTKLPPTPADGQSRASSFPVVSPYGVRP